MTMHFPFACRLPKAEHLVCNAVQGHAVYEADKHRFCFTSLLLAASANASCAEKVLLPTPPLPDRTSILCKMLRMRCSMARRSGSGPLGAVAQISWLGHPAQAALLPAVSLLVPGQSAAAQKRHGKHVHESSCSEYQHRCVIAAVQQTAEAL